jgi:hypothetical protein
MSACVTFLEPTDSASSDVACECVVRAEGQVAHEGSLIEESESHTQIFRFKNHPGCERRRRVHVLKDHGFSCRRLFHKRLIEIACNLEWKNSNSKLAFADACRR